MDPILDEMRRVKSVADIRESRYRHWLAYLADKLAKLAEYEAAASKGQPARKGAA